MARAMLIPNAYQPAKQPTHMMTHAQCISFLFNSLPCRLIGSELTIATIHHWWAARSRSSGIKSDNQLRSECPETDSMVFYKCQNGMKTDWEDLRILKVNGMMGTWANKSWTPFREIRWQWTRLVFGWWDAAKLIDWLVGEEGLRSNRIWSFVRELSVDWSNHYAYGFLNVVLSIRRFRSHQVRLERKKNWSVGVAWSLNSRQWSMSWNGHHHNG